MSDPDHPPRNRTATSLPSLAIEVEHADGILRFDPNSQIVHLYENTEEVLRLKPVPGQVSLISGQPAIVCRMPRNAVGHLWNGDIIPRAMDSQPAQARYRDYFGIKSQNISIISQSYAI